MVSKFHFIFRMFNQILMNGLRIKTDTGVCRPGVISYRTICDKGHQPGVSVKSSSVFTGAPHSVFAIVAEIFEAIGIFAVVNTEKVIRDSITIPS